MMKVVVNLIILVVLAMPIALVCSDSLFLFALGAWYGYEYVKNIIVPLERRYREIKRKEEGR
jgi:hypothetical protein